MAGQAGEVGKPPAHYDHAISPFKIIDAFKLGFYTGNAVKYLVRYQFKGSGLDDLKKALHYVQEAVLRYEGGQTHV